MEIKIIIEKTKDHFSAYAVNIEGVYAAGNSIKEVKDSVLEAIDIMNELYPEKKISKQHIQYVYDVETFLKYYSDIFTRASLSRLTGINEKQLGHYIQGVHKPRKDKVEKIERALNNLGKELLELELL